MKKNNLFMLASLLALGGLTNCGGNNFQTKPDVYFKAHARTIDEKTEKEVDFKDSECAEMTVEDKENLKYGEKDVVIHISPKRFFTFREYNEETWEPTSAPSHPYVGLGNPHTLYNYPLQENVAWTFEDKSTPSSDYPGFYHEEYVITVKKEYFQKNIVIDYGNVDSYNNKIYVYNSSFYQNMFKNAGIGGDFADSYKLDIKSSSFLAGSKGATVTYTFKSNESPYTFDGWDKYTKPKSSENADPTYYYYDHFKILVSNEGGAQVNIARFDPTKEEQDFVPTVKGHYLSFFIKWDVLADEYTEPKFDTIKVELGEPTISSDVSEIKVDSMQGVTVYPCDYFQHPDKNTNKAFAKDGKNLDTFDDGGTLSFTNVLCEQDGIQSDKQIQYSTIFQMPDGNKYFSIEMNGQEIFDIDLSGEQELQYTTWREAEEVTYDADGNEVPGVETPYWTYSNDSQEEGDPQWRLVQLNSVNNGSRTYGLPEKFVGKENLYYLYTDDLNALKATLGNGGTISIKIKEAPTLVTFTLKDDGTTRTYGRFDNNDFIREYLCGGKSFVDIKFIPEGGYETYNFVVTLEGETAVDYRATYSVARPGTTYATIHIENTKGGTFNENDTFTLALAPKTTFAVLNSQSRILGNLVNSNWQPVEELELAFQETGEEEIVEIRFRFDNEVIASKAILESESGRVVSSDVLVDIDYNGSPVSPGLISLSVEDDVTIKITMQFVKGSYGQIGAKFGVSIKFMYIELYTDIGEQEAHIEYMGYGSISNNVGTQDTIRIFVVFDTASYNCNITQVDVTNTPTWPDGGYSVEEADDGVLISIYNYDFSQYNSIQNGTAISIYAEFRY